MPWERIYALERPCADPETGLVYPRGKAVTIVEEREDGWAIVHDPVENRVFRVQQRYLTEITPS